MSDQEALIQATIRRMTPYVQRMIRESNPSAPGAPWRPAILGANFLPGAVGPVRVDGDIAPMDAVNLTGMSLAAGARVQVQFTEPHGIDIVGYISGRLAVPYTPTVTATPTSPTLGSGFTSQGWFSVNGGVVQGHAIIKCGASGTAVGSGTYAFQLPYPVMAPGTTDPTPIGVGRIVNGADDQLLTPMLTDALAGSQICILQGVEASGFTLDAIFHTPPVSHAYLGAAANRAWHFQFRYFAAQ